MSLQFLGHIISAKGVEADPLKITAVANWPRPKSNTEVRSFLSLVRYISAFLPKLVYHTAILTPLTMKDLEKKFPPWMEDHQKAFKAIKQLILSRQCLTVIDHENPGDQKIYMTCDASDVGTGAVLSFGTSWEDTRPVAFELSQLNAAEQNYPVHKKELLSIVKALKQWRFDLLGLHFKIYMDHCTLESFLSQRDLSRCQARWQEFLVQYDFEILYIKGEDNTIADALSQLDHPLRLIVAPVFTISPDLQLLH